MDPEFQRVLIRVTLIGGAILAVGAGVLVVAFRAFSPSPRPGRDFRASLLIGGVLAFVLIMCLMLFRLSMVK